MFIALFIALSNHSSCLMIVQGDLPELISCKSINALKSMGNIFIQIYVQVLIN